jgi:hypothetical protein
MKFDELLKTLGLEDDVIKKILNGMKENKIYTASEENLDVRYGKLKADHDNLIAEHEKSTGLIAELQKATKDNEGIQNQITDYQNQIQTLQEEALKAKTESALKIGLLSAGAKPSDIDYLLFKMEHDSDWKPELDDQGKVKGLDEKLKGLKTQFPAQFEGTSSKKIDEKKLEKSEGKTSVTKEEFKKMGYQDRLNFKKSNPELFKEFMKG